MATKKRPKSSARPKARTSAPEKPNGIAWLKLSFQDASYRGSPLLKNIFWGLAALAFAWMLVTALGTGINGDDKMQNEYEQALITWYATGGRDTTALNLPQTKMHYYGGVFEVLSGATNRLLGFSDPYQEGYHQVRHAWNALFGWLGVLFIGLTAALLLGWEAAIVALLMAFLSPRFVGHGIMNPKDIPFATGYIISLFYILQWMRHMPRPDWRVLTGLTLGLGLAIGVRAGGLILVAIFGLWALLHFLGRYGVAGLWKEARMTGQYLLYGLIPVLGGLMLAILFWPFAMQSPVAHLQEALAELSNYGVNIRLLFNGDMVFAQSLPWDYLPRWVWVTTPLFVFVGWVAAIAATGRLWRRIGSLPLSMLWFSFLFPFLYVIYKSSTLYDGWRHLLFPYTVGVVLAAAGLYGAATWRPDLRWLKPAVYGIAGLLAIHPIWHMLSNPHIQYVYFNQIQGGAQGALGKYETDYWGVSVKKGLAWLEKEGIITPGMDRELTIASNFGYQLDKYGRRYGENLKTVYVRYRQRHDAAWDYGLFVSRFVDAAYIQKGHWPPENTIHTIQVSGLPVLAIVKQDNQLAFEGISLQKQSRFTEAIPLLEQAVQQTPGDEVAWVSLAFCYLNIQQMEDARRAIEKTLDLDPDNITAYNYYGLYYVNTNNIDQAIRMFEKAVEIQENNFFPYYYLSLLEMQRNNLSLALEYGKLAVGYNPSFKGGYEQVANVYQAMGDMNSAEAYRQAAAQLN